MCHRFVFATAAAVCFVVRRTPPSCRTLATLCVLFAANCGHPRAALPPLAPPVPPPAPAGPTANAGAVGPLALGALDITLPRCPPDATGPVADFCRAATRAVRRAFDDDSDDAALCLSLLNGLELQPELSAVASSWRSPLHNALARSQLLARLAAPLRQLRRAFADAYLDPRTELYRGIDATQCRRAFAQLQAEPDVPLDLVVTIEPMGSYPLAAFRRLCLHDRRLRLSATGG